jgi:hypothetical protein
MNDPFQHPSLTGYTTTVLTPWGRETYQVWLDEVPSGWIARIVTLPNRIWAMHGGREAVKLYGATADEAETAARRFIEAECAKTNRRIAAPVKDLETTPSAPQPALRTPKRLLVRFGKGEPERPGVTANLSETGLFIITDRPVAPGAPVSIDLRMPEGPVPLAGVAVWTREKRAPGLSVGFGVRLTHRPPQYVNGVKALQTTASPDF